MKGIFLSILFLTCMSANGLTQSEVDVSGLPKANYSEQLKSLDRWGAMVGNVLEVKFQLDDDERGIFYTSLIDVRVVEGKGSFILFPHGGSETDIYIYRLSRYNQDDVEMDNIEVRKKIFFINTEDMERAVRVDDLTKGFYYVSYISCNFGGSYILHIQ